MSRSRLHGFCRFALLFLLVHAAGAQTFTVVHDLAVPEGNGPRGRLLVAKDGSVYGATAAGGDTSQCGGGPGCGTIFRLDPAGNFSVFHVFTESEGSQPSELIEASDGNFYGTTARLGGVECVGTFGTGCGTIFRITPAGELTVLHRFTGMPGDATSPNGGLVQASDGALYGVAGGIYTYPDGVIFKLDLSGNFSIVHRFARAVDGMNPIGPLVQASDGYLYGVTYGNRYTTGSSKLYRATLAGLVTVLRTFPTPECVNGGLVQGKDGGIYGTEQYLVGANGGEVYRLDPVTKAFTVVHAFPNISGVDGFTPRTGLAMAADGSLYGATINGSAVDPNVSRGVIFKVDPAGTYSVVHSFITATEGSYPMTPPAESAPGTFYGTTFALGANRAGTVYRFGSSGVAQLASVRLEPASVMGTNTSRGTVTLQAPAPSGGALIALVSDAPQVASVPASVTIAAGATSATFTVATTNVAEYTSLRISAEYNGRTVSAPMSIAPLEFSDIYLQPESVAGGAPATGVVSLTGPAGPGGAVVALASDTAGVKVPAGVTVAAGNESAAFPITTSPVGTTHVATIHASFHGASGDAFLEVTPAAAVSLDSLGVTDGGVEGGFPTTLVVMLDRGAPAGGALITLASANPAILQTPATVTVPAGATEASFVCTTSAVAATTWIDVTASYNGLTASAAEPVMPPITGFTLTPATVSGGSNSTGTVTLAMPAPSGGATVSLASSRPAVAALPATVFVPAGSKTANFNVTTSAPSASTTVVVSGTFHGRTATANLVVNASAGVAQLSTLSLYPTIVRGGYSSSGRILLTKPAPAGGLKVTLRSSNTLVAVVASYVLVPAGATSARFTVTTRRVTATKYVTITGTLGVSRSATLTVKR